MNIDRYHRHSLIDWFSQDDVKASSFAIIGCGAVGNEVAKNLALLGVGKIDLFDFDTIEIHNLTRSVLFRESDIGLSKADVAGIRVKELEPEIEVNSYHGDFWDLLTFKQAKSYDCIVCCVDNFEARIRLNQICLITKTNLINTGIDSKFSQIEIFPFKSGEHIACYECNLPDSVYERMQKRYSCGWLKKISFIEKKIPTTIITSSLTAALAVSNALNLLNNPSESTAKRILIDSFTGHSTVSTIEQSALCPGCASFHEPISVISGKAEIESVFDKQLNDDICLTTSEPILVSFQCIKCNPSEEKPEVVFQLASHFDSSLTICKTCGSDSVDVTIKDSFSINELLSQYAGKTIPTKFIRFEHENRTTIIELE